MVCSRRRGKKTPTLLPSPTGDGERELEAKTGSACLATIRRSVRECRESLGPPVSRTEPKTPRIARAIPSKGGGVHAVKAA